MKQFFVKFQKRSRKVIVLFCSLIVIQQGNAQILNPYGTSYFEDQYLSNPAMAGVPDQTLHLDAGYRKELLSVPGGPVNQYLSGTYGITDKVGLGLMIYNDKAGLLGSTQVMGTYAYHFALNSKKSQLLLGISAGVLNEHVDNSAINGDVEDPTISEFNGRSYHFMADFGAAYTNGKLTVQGALPGLPAYFNNDQQTVSDKTLLFSAVSYRLTLNPGGDEVTMEPKFCYRIIHGFDNILDAGADVSFLNNFIDFFGMYHTSKNATFGAGLNIKKRLKIMTIYTTGASALKGYTNGGFEIGLALAMGKEAK